MRCTKKERPSSRTALIPDHYNLRPEQTGTDLPPQPETIRATIAPPLKSLFTFPHVKQMFRITRGRKHVKSGDESITYAYGITSLSPEKASPERLLSLNRGHWTIENGNHRRRDTAFREDTCLARTGHGPANNVAFNNLALAIILSNNFDCIPAANDHSQAHRDDALKHILAKRPHRS